MLGCFFCHLKLDVEARSTVLPDLILCSVFPQLNPSASLPVLRDGGKLLTQSKEIVTYLDDIDGSPLGGKSVDRKQVSQWVDLTAPWDGNLVGDG